jgi:hypothetical protein
MRILGRNLTVLIICLWLILIFKSQPTSALPIGFGYNQGDLEFIEVRSKNFRVYQDKRAPEDAKLALKSLEAAKPHLERWFQTRRNTPLVVNMSAVSDHASFANFVTDSIELQTLGQGGRDLAWHEYTHSTMYRHLDNWFGPAGAIIHLPWMEAWFLEGLAEAISVSIGSDEQAGIERFQALTNNWPTWDRIHSLYTSGPFNYRGYATSGAFVSWMLRYQGADKLPRMLRNFQDSSMPWFWPWALTPFNGFWPMDHALRDMTNKSGKELYEQYKIDATAHWKSVITTPILSLNAPTEQALESPWLWHGINGKPRRTSTPEDAASFQGSQSGNIRTWISAYFPRANQRRYKIAFSNAPAKTPNFLHRSGATWIDGPWISAKKIHWLETSPQTMRLCEAPQAQFKSSAVTCRLDTVIPQRLRYLGSTKDPSGAFTQELVFVRDHETIKGDQHDLIYVKAHDGSKIVVKTPTGGRPISFASSEKNRWYLVADDAWRHLLRTSPEGQCEGMITLSDFPVRIIDSTTERPYVILYTVDGYQMQSLDPGKFPLQPCRPLTTRTSPLLAAIRSEHSLSLQQAMDRSNTWTSTKTILANSKVNDQKTQSVPNAADKTVETNNEISFVDDTKIKTTDATSESMVRPAKWRGRPVFVFPWIGADDAMGSQVGLISVPLMDEMQNETIRATVLVGIASRFPYQDLTITSNRFLPTWSLSGFRAQTYNGRYKDRTTGLLSSKYLEESGVHGDGSISNYWKYLSIDMNWGVKTSHLKPYIGPAKRVGHLNEVYAGLSTSASNGGRLFVSTSLRARAAPQGMNSVFNYDVLGASLTTGAKINDGKIELGLDGSRTRGPKRRDLQEMYQPLKTLIPGSGGGYNQTSYALSQDYGLFTPVFGENQARARLLATHPILKDIDKFTGLVYLSHMDFSGFFNYGTAWRSASTPKKSQLIAAQGYNLDLFMDNKGVNFNLGLGTGQVLGKTWQGYWTFGFDAFF